MRENFLPLQNLPNQNLYFHKIPRHPSLSHTFLPSLSSWLSNVFNSLLICITINFHQNLIKIIVFNYLLKFFQLSSLSLPYLFKIFIKHAYVGYPALLFFPNFFFFISMDSSSSHQTQTTLHLPIIYKSLLQPYSKSLTLFLSALPLPIVCFNCCPL